ncbi:MULTISPECIES: HPP family protein [Calothrix]|uniref:HPP family protein n=2 Tax=Calothrix TaxID=1186 RepID=A0ABR8AHR9_9CYAN|nr:MULTISPECIES: HPP family protein [Calothrix]MBD2199566.1 HPP family protein [Calothrix parietina FACHB-288]MBD2228281.1 HPP family protein [Calothrix anomala FACHB-343]
MKSHRSSLKPLEGANRSLRRRLNWKGELALATAPTIVILSVFALVEVLTRQRLLFASLASSAFLIYLDPQHGTNTVRTLVISQMMAAGIGFATYMLLGSGYLSGGSAMIITIVLMILLDVMHPPAVATSLSFALKAGNENNLVLFGLAVGITTVLVGLERFALWLLAKFSLK